MRLRQLVGLAGLLGWVAVLLFLVVPSGPSALAQDEATIELQERLSEARMRARLKGLETRMTALDEQVRMQTELIAEIHERLGWQQGETHRAPEEPLEDRPR